MNPNDPYIEIALTSKGVLYFTIFDQGVEDGVEVSREDAERIMKTIQALLTVIPETTPTSVD